MLERLVFGEVPPKHHLALRGSDGSLRYEECLTRAGFDGPYTILYHLNRPQALTRSGARAVLPALEPMRDAPLERRHFLGGRVQSMGSPLFARVPLLFNRDVTLSIATPTESDTTYVVDADADALVFVHEGGGTLHSALGDLRFEREDYVYVPKGLLHRFELSGTQSWLVLSCAGGVGIPKQWRNEVGQLRMDAPYCHRDFRGPEFRGPIDEGIRRIVVRRGPAAQAFAVDHSPLDVVGWDGAIYPWAFPIRSFQPRVGPVHLPPTWHGTFVTRGALICSFVPRPLDFHPEAIPCPYPHSSVDVDEILYYVSGDFTSRSGIGSKSLTLHPAGIPHGPQPGRYEASIGATRTDELAVMLDCSEPIQWTQAARSVEDPKYEASFR